MTTSYPPGQIKLYGINQALTNQSTWIAYKGIDGTIFHLAGPQAPMAGAQDGLVLKKFMGLMAPFENLELRGARQDGATWTDSVFDVGEIMLGLELSGTSPQNTRDVMRRWIGAWSAKQTGVLSVFTPDMGEWWANVRLGKNVSDMFEKDYTWSGKQPFTWSAKNYDAFWYGVDSTSSFQIVSATLVADFTTMSNASSLDDNWTQVYSSTAHGSCGVVSKACSWIPNDAVAASVENYYNTPTASDNQVVGVRFAGATHATGVSKWQGTETSYIDLWARVSADHQTGIRARLFLASTAGPHSVKVSCFNDGVETPWFTTSVSLTWGDTIALNVGYNSNQYGVRVVKNGTPFHSFTDTAHTSQVGPDFRGHGFGEATAVDTHGELIIPAPIALYAAGDWLTSTQSGFLPLTNLGNVEAWPRYLCYGPGTFSFSNGPGSSSMVTFGPLLDGQIALITTEPRLRSVVDLSPSAPAGQPLSSIQSLLESLISFATNNNTPPLLQQFESIFGVRPPQGNLYTLLNGRFTNPLPPNVYGISPVAEQIAVSILDGTPDSKIVASVTPRRTWPL